MNRMEANRRVGLDLSPLACAECRDSKRRCDRTYPKCTLCIRRQIRCEYPTRRKERHPRRRRLDLTPASNSSHMHHSVPVAEAQDALPPHFTRSTDHRFISMFFLDPNLFHRANLELPRIHVNISKAISDIVGSVQNIQSVATRFFNSVHTWMPIISRRDFFANLLNNFSYRRAELFLMTLSMKLSFMRVISAECEFYRIVKDFLREVEYSGVLSLRVLQAKVLINLYEIGHAVYPAAFLSLGDCARYGTALGIQDSIKSPAVTELNWTEEEESRRVWWSILVLDRFINLNDPQRFLVTANPDSDSRLPVDDSAWDSGNFGRQDITTLGHATHLRMGRFARFAQAAYLLGQALDCTAAEVQHTSQLRRTIFALINLSDIEGNMRQLEFCTQTAVCYSALILLEESFAPLVQGSNSLSVPRSALSPETNGVLKGASQIVRNLSSELPIPEAILDQISPFLLHFLYKVSVLLQKLEDTDQPIPSKGNLVALKQTLKRLNNRWLSADTYITLLDTRETLQLMRESEPSTIF